jgi:acyl-CoA reductase-like NAD-dependent aldehyde dehydrogenase
MINVKSLICGKLSEGSEVKESVSPIDNSVVANIEFLSESELEAAFKSSKEEKQRKEKKDFEELTHLANYFRENREVFTKQIMLDSGFIKKDAEDLVEGSIEFCEDYSKHLDQLSLSDTVTSFSFKGSKTKIRHTSTPYGLIAATTPRNTPLITELTIVVHALWSGNAVIIRPSPGVAGTVALLIKGLLECFSPQTLSGLSIVFANAKDFVNSSLSHANLLHYVGSTKYIETTLIAGINKGVKVLLDGDGCSLAVIDSDVDLDEAVKACYHGLIRCNGEICITIRVILVAENIYEEFRSKFLQYIRQIKIVPPDATNESQMGPLFSSAQVEAIGNVAKKYKILEGNPEPLEFGPNYISPIVVELDESYGSFLSESVFGPIVGLASYRGDGWKKWIKENPINLTDAVFSKRESFIKEFIETSHSPRRVINMDPTIESVFEPWGAFLPSGWNDVSYWYDKYRNYFQIVEE